MVTSRTSLKVHFPSQPRHLGELPDHALPPPSLVVVVVAVFQMWPPPSRNDFASPRSHRRMPVINHHHHHHHHQQQQQQQCGIEPGHFGSSSGSGYSPNPMTTPGMTVTILMNKDARQNPKMYIDQNLASQPTRKGERLKKSCETTSQPYVEIGGRWIPINQMMEAQSWYDRASVYCAAQTVGPKEPSDRIILRNQKLGKSVAGSALKTSPNCNIQQHKRKLKCSSSTTSSISPPLPPHSITNQRGDELDEDIDANESWWFSSHRSSSYNHHHHHPHLMRLDDKCRSERSLPDEIEAQYEDVEYKSKIVEDEPQLSFPPDTESEEDEEDDDTVDEECNAKSRKRSSTGWGPDEYEDRILGPLKKKKPKRDRKQQDDMQRQYLQELKTVIPDLSTLLDHQHQSAKLNILLAARNYIDKMRARVVSLQHERRALVRQNNTLKAKYERRLRRKRKREDSFVNRLMGELGLDVTG
ncbi:hypothetical protein ACOME3_007299 [Neoechinorhynchus agilis]